MSQPGCIRTPEVEASLDGRLSSEAAREVTQHVKACGRCRERQPEASVYNRLCDIEWDTPVGPAAACGGNAMLRLSALAESGGFDEVLIAGEEPELCFRLRRAGWGVQRLAAEMVRHDAAIFSWRQWWQRNQRAGFSYANGCHLHGASSERYYRRELRSILFWGLALPVSALTMAWVHPLGLAILLVYPLQYWRLKRRFRAEGRIPAADCGQYAIHLIAGKFPSLLGVLSFHRHRLQGRRRSLIEYK